MSENSKKKDNTLKTLNFTKFHTEENYRSIFGLREAGQQNLYNNTIEKLNIILDAVKDRYSFMQYGAKTGELYYTHAIKGIHLILQLQDNIFDPAPQRDKVSLNKLKLYCLSYLIHDLNKFKWYRGKVRSELWSIKTVQAEIEAINSITNEDVITNFFSEWKKYLNDIYTLVLGHSRIHRYSGRLVFSDVEKVFGIDTTSLNTILSKEELTKGINVMQLVDILDLIKEFSFQTIEIEQVDKVGNHVIGTINQGEILKHSTNILSQILDENVVLEKVSVTMNTSKFSNVMLNCIIDILGKEYSILPLLVFTNGVIFFARRTDMVKASTPENIVVIEQKIADRFVKIVDSLIMNKINEKGFLYSIRGQGVKIGDYIFQQPNEKNKMKKMLFYLSKNLEPFAFKGDRKKSSRYKTLQKSNDYINEEIKDHPLIEKWKDGENWDLIGEDSLWKMARFCHTIFINVLKLYKRNNKKVDQAELMSEFLEHLDIFSELSEIYEQGSDLPQWYRYGFFHLVADVLYSKKKMIEDITTPMIEYFLDKMDELTIEDFAIPNPAELVKSYVHLFRSKTLSSQLLQQVNPANKIICTVCGKRMESLGSIKKDQIRYKWFSEYVPDGISVQKFTNFKVAGEKKEPVRMICGACKWRFYLEKIMSLVSGKFSTVYSTFYLSDGYPYAIIRGIQRTLEDLKDNPNYGDQIKAFMVDFNNYKKNRISVRPQKAYGFALPTILQEICGSIPLSWKLKDGISISEQFWELIKQVFAISTQTRLKVIISKLRNDYEELLGKNDILLQDITSDYKWLFGDEIKFSFKNGRIILEIMIDLEELITSITRKDVIKHCVATIKHLQFGNLNVIHYLDSLIRSPSSIVKRSKNQAYQTMVLRGDVLSKLNEIYELKSKIK